MDSLNAKRIPCFAQAMTPDSFIPDCAGGLEVFRAINDRARRRRFPFAASAALTYRCNLECVHCYARTSADARREWSTEQWKDQLDQLAKSDCLFLLITGGEPLLRPDFADIYRYARACGLVVTVFTNGTRITDEIVELFRAYPPRNVDVTVYGASESTTRAITGRAGVLDSCLTGVRKLKDGGVRVGLKTVAMTLNRGEIEALEALADGLGVPFRLDASIFPRFDGDTGPLKYRLSPREIADIDFATPVRAGHWKSHYQRRCHKLGEGALYRCSAGRTHAHINPHGELQPCITTSHIRFPLAGSDFPVVWQRMKDALECRRAHPDSTCIHCEKHVLCGYCPGFSRLETGDESGVSPFLCELGQERSRRIIDMTEAVG